MLEHAPDLAYAHIPSHVYLLKSKAHYMNPRLIFIKMCNI